MSSFAPPAFVPVQAEKVIDAGMAALSEKVLGGTVERWYHDLPVWLFRGPGITAWRVLQVGVVVGRGELFAQLSTRSEFVVDGALFMPKRLNMVRQMPLGTLTVDDFVGALIEAWDEEGSSGPDGPGGSDEWVSVATDWAREKGPDR